MTNTQSLSGTRSFGKRFLPLMRGSVVGIQPSPLCRSGAKADEIQQGNEVKQEMMGQGEWAQIPKCPPIPWSEPSLFFCTDQGTRLIRSPPIDLGLHFSSVDHWLLADLDVGLDELADSTLQDYSPRLEAHSQCQVFYETNPSMKPAQAEKRTCRGKNLASLSEAAKREGKRKRAEAQLEGPNNLVVNDVRAIFQAVHSNAQPPAHLSFQIVLSTEGQKISPPSFKFESEFQSESTFCSKFSILTLSRYRRSLPLDETHPEETAPSYGSGKHAQSAFRIDGLRHAGYSSVELSLEHQRSPIRKANGYPETILLFKRRCILQQSQGRHLVDSGT
jgi:hypothetical protein